MSSISTTTTLQLSATTIDELQGLSEMLQRIFVRNKNQHRRSHWWKALKGFKRDLGLVLAELAALHTAGPIGSIAATPSASKSAVARRLQARLRVLSEDKMHGWYMTFTQLVAAGQFAAVGLVLMAAVARVAKLLGVTDVYEEIASADMRAVLDRFSAGGAVGAFGGLKAGHEEGEGYGGYGGDEGEVVERGWESDDGEVA
ncbi:hypothetical protein AOQ84DRAFT_405294 [Glonium stellatum]|uniref:RNase MRP protein 1 RNA binding domain-containing protein n=1 Tax=Glonium stellatum TaxID=574774 RepID=A0A8E2JTH9_9PEZI|nr:hypothetical protein AOQ84DRAFT_405294 [Glonium stellatum]